MHGACFVVLFFFPYAWQVADAGGKKQGNFEEVMEAINECVDPNPAFAKKRLVTVDFSIHKLKGAQVMSGRWSVKADVPFQNFTMNTFTKDDSGRKELKIHLEKLNCRSLIAQTFLIAVNLRFDKKKCLLLKGNFEEVMEAFNDCIDPNPAFAKKRLVTTDFDIHQLKGATVVSGRWSIKADVPFKNFTMSTFTTDGYGRRELKFRLEKLNCRNLIAQTFLIAGNLRFDRKKCLLLKGNITFKDVDFNKLSHTMPHWHSEGSLIHQMQLVHRSETIFCFEVLFTVKQVG